MFLLFLLCFTSYAALVENWTYQTAQKDPLQYIGSSQVLHFILEKKEENEIVALSSKDGTETWRVSLDQGDFSFAKLKEDFVYVVMNRSDGEDFLFILDAHNGDLLAKKSLGFAGALQEDQFLFLKNQVVHFYGATHTRTADSKIISRHLKTGKILWEASLRFFGKDTFRLISIQGRIFAFTQFCKEALEEEDRKDGILTCFMKKGEYSEHRVLLSLDFKGQFLDQWFFNELQEFETKFFSFDLQKNQIISEYRLDLNAQLFNVPDHFEVSKGMIFLSYGVRKSFLNIWDVYLKAIDQISGSAVSEAQYTQEGFLTGVNKVIRNGKLFIFSNDLIGAYQNFYEFNPRVGSPLVFYAQPYPKQNLLNEYDLKPCFYSTEDQKKTYSFICYHPIYQKFYTKYAYLWNELPLQQIKIGSHQILMFFERQMTSYSR